MWRRGKWKSKLALAESYRILAAVMVKPFNGNVGRVNRDCRELNPGRAQENIKHQRRCPKMFPGRDNFSDFWSVLSENRCGVLLTIKHTVHYMTRQMRMNSRCPSGGTPGNVGPCADILLLFFVLLGVRKEERRNAMKQIGQNGDQSLLYQQYERFPPSESHLTIRHKAPSRMRLPHDISTVIYHLKSSKVLRQTVQPTA
jgi:hypothetical protein